MRKKRTPSMAPAVDTVYVAPTPTPTPSAAPPQPVKENPMFRVNRANLARYGLSRAEEVSAETLEERGADIEALVAEGSLTPLTPPAITAVHQTQDHSHVVDADLD